MKVFLDDTDFWIGRLRKQACPPQCGWSTSNPLKTWIGQKREKERIPFLWLVLNWDIALFPSSDWNWKISSSWLSSLSTFCLEVTLSALLILRPLDLDSNYTTNLLGLQTANCWSWYFSASITTWVNSLYNFLIARDINDRYRWYRLNIDISPIVSVSCRTQTATCYLPDYLIPIKGWLGLSFYWTFLSLLLA